MLGSGVTLFDKGSQYGYSAIEQKTGGYALRGPTPDWAMDSDLVPTLSIDMMIRGAPSGIVLNATSYPGQVQLQGSFATANLQLTATLIFIRPDASLLKIDATNMGQHALSDLQFVLQGTAPNSTCVTCTKHFETINDRARVAFDLPGRTSIPGPCFNGSGFHHGVLHLPRGDKGAWTIQLKSSTKYSAISPVLPDLAAGATATIFIVIAAGLASPEDLVPEVSDVTFGAEVDRWNGYLTKVLRGKPPTEEHFQMQYMSVKAMQTLLHNWRGVPGSSDDGVLPSYENYDSGMWSWDTYKQAVGMVDFAPELAKQQIRVIIAGRDRKTGHIPDKIDRCGIGGGCSGKPPLLSWSVWEIYRRTKDHLFLKEMYPRIEQFHRYWYLNRDVQGVGFCSWTEGMESGMDDGIRFINATSASNQTSHVSALNFHSIDLNSYLYRDKRIMAKMAMVLNNVSGVKMWTAEADVLLPRLQAYFFVQSSEPFFQDIYYTTAPTNLQARTAGQPVPVQGCEGYAALFCEVATLTQAQEMATTLSDPSRFLLNFSLPTASMANPNFGLESYWKGSTWIDQVWFAYTGLNLYASKLRDAGSTAEAKRLSSLAAEIKHRTFTNGQGFGANDTVPFNEHYNPETGRPIGAQHFSWTAAHVLMWTGEEFDKQPLQVPSRLGHKTPHAIPGNSMLFV